MPDPKKFQNRRFQIVGSSVVTLLLCVGSYLLYQDLLSLIQDSQANVERTASAGARIIAPSLVELSLLTKDSQSTSDSQLQDQLFELATRLKVQGSLSIVDPRSEPYRLLATTRPGLRKGDLFTPPESFTRNGAYRIDQTTVSSLYRHSNGFWITSQTSLQGSQGQTLAVLIYDSDASPLFYRLLSYGLHYLLLAVGLMTVGGFLYLWNAFRATRALSLARNLEMHLFREVSDGVILLDAQGKIEKISDAALRLIGENPEALKGRALFGNFQKSFLFVPLDPAKDVIKLTLNAGERFRSKAKLVLLDEQTRYVSFSSSPLSNGTEILGAAIVFEDSTQDMIREQELIHSQPAQNQDLKTLFEVQMIGDPLTHCLNRTYLNYFLQWDRIQWMSYEGCSMLAIDIDSFRKLNETIGHQGGDEVLKRFASFLKQFFRRGDKIVRTGGDDFVVILPQTDLPTAERIGQNLINALSKAPGSLGLSVCVGVAELQPKEEGPTWFHRAQAALRRAKEKSPGGIFLSDLSRLEIVQ